MVNNGTTSSILAPTSLETNVPGPIPFSLVIEVFAYGFKVDHLVDVAATLIVRESTMPPILTKRV